MVTHDPETLINAVVCAVIAIRLLTFRRDGGAHVQWAAWLAYCLILATGSVTIRIAMGAYEGTTDPAELFINAVLCVMVLRAKGNVVQLFKVRRGSDA
ncbi:MULTISPECIES: phage holin family protein [unclassified Serratia (in: enterobacteria)]|uniref:phage holin family protein n=1 Tax=unclassified Serratia (in: enterobacteria) TaxID=2647522 RepID=UPI003075FB4C